MKFIYERPWIKKSPVELCEILADSPVTVPVDTTETNDDDQATGLSKKHDSSLDLDSIVGKEGQSLLWRD